MAKRMLWGLLSAALLGQALADGYKVEWRTVSSGGGTISGGVYRISCTVAQPAAGFTSGFGILHWVGFWSGDVPVPTVAAGIGDTKRLADGTFVSVAGKIVNRHAILTHRRRPILTHLRTLDSRSTRWVTVRRRTYAQEGHTCTPIHTNCGDNR